MNALDREAMTRFGLSLKEPTDDLVTFEVDEADAQWPAIEIESQVVV